MKRIICLLFVFVFLLHGCVSNNSEPADNSATNTSNYDPVDLSYVNVEQLSDFKCYVSYDNEAVTVDGVRAKELYKLTYSALHGQGNTSAFPDSKYVYLVFYTSPDEFPSENIDTFYGSYTIHEDGLLVFSGSPYHSAAFTYETEPGLFYSVIDITFGSN